MGVKLFKNTCFRGPGLKVGFGFYIMLSKIETTDIKVKFVYEMEYFKRFKMASIFK